MPCSDAVALSICEADLDGDGALSLEEQLDLRMHLQERSHVDALLTGVCAVDLQRSSKLCLNMPCVLANLCCQAVLQLFKSNTILASRMLTAKRPALQHMLGHSLAATLHLNIEIAG